MPLQSSKTRRFGTAFKAICIGIGLRKASQTTAGPDGQDFHNVPATLTRLDKGSFVLASPGAIAAGGFVEVTAALPDAQIAVSIDGAIQSDLIILNGPATLEAGLDVGSERITALNTVTFRIYNTTAGGITPALNTYQYFIVRS